MPSTRLPRHGERVVIDVEGVRLKKPKPKALPRKLTMSTPSKMDLSRLDDAIHNHGNPYRTEYYNVCRRYDISEDFDEFVDKQLGMIQRKALRYCWDVLKWRPNQSGNGIRPIENPYPIHVNPGRSKKAINKP